jgi:DNA-nicking Smr family endonuclease
VGAKKDKKKKGRGPSPFEALRELREELAKKESSAKKPPAAPPPPARRPARDEAPEDEALLLHRMFAGVRPLDAKRARVPVQAVEPSASAQRMAAAREVARAEAEAVHERLRSLVEGTARFEVVDDGRRVEGRRGDVPADLVRKLRRGLFPIDARLDLHGMGAREARGQLELFLRTMRARGERCVLVVHGKGEHSPRGVGVLRGEIGAWLSQGTASEQVAAFSTAREGDGGEGAVYVLIRR